MKKSKIKKEEQEIPTTLEDKSKTMEIKLGEGEILSDFYDCGGDATDDDEPDFEKEIKITRK